MYKVITVLPAESGGADVGGSANTPEEILKKARGVVQLHKHTHPKMEVLIQSPDGAQHTIRAFHKIHT